MLDKDGNALPGRHRHPDRAENRAQIGCHFERRQFPVLESARSGEYTVKFELQGFKTIVREKLVVSFGRDVTIDPVMEQATIEESVTVVGQTPVIDTKKTQVGINITNDMIMSLPNSRNPWVLMALAPGMMIDREDVGGNEGGQQSSYYGHGSASGDSTWNVDGANITDNSALGAAPAYLNVSSYEELQINYGNNDITSQTGGVQINFITKRGGNKFSGTFFMDAEDKDWQSTEPDRPAEVLRVQGRRRQQDLSLRRQLRRPDHQGQRLVLRLLRHPGHRHGHPGRDERQHLAGLRLCQARFPAGLQHPDQRPLPARQQAEIRAGRTGERRSRRPKPSGTRSARRPCTRARSNRCSATSS